MQYLKKLVSLALLGCVLLVSSAVQAADMTVSAAASLTNAFTELARGFEKKHPGLHVALNFAASNPLLKQIQEGAPVDVLATADQTTMNSAESGKLILPVSRKNFAMNDVVLVVPKGGKRPASLSDLSSFAKIAIGNPNSVPAGRYAKAALTSAGLWEKLSEKYILGNSVRQVLDYVARGEVDAGFVYRTDALLKGDKVDLVMPVGGHDPVLYPIAVVLTGKNAAMGQSFIDYVLSKDGMAVLSRYGFAAP
jgi:molybdate transport system substrate-binding protein